MLISRRRQLRDVDEERQAEDYLKNVISFLGSTILRNLKWVLKVTKSLYHVSHRLNLHVETLVCYGRLCDKFVRYVSSRFCRILVDHTHNLFTLNIQL